MAFDALPRQLCSGAGPQDETPVRGLGQQQFTGSLAEHLQILFPCNTTTATSHHGFAGFFPLWNDPGVAFVQPVIVIATLSPAGGARVTELQLLGPIQHISQAGEGNPFRGSLPEQLGEKRRAFKPPVAKKFRIERGHQQRADSHGSAELIQLLTAAAEVVAGMGADPFGSQLRSVGLFLFKRRIVIGDAMQFQPKGTWLGQAKGLEMFKREIPAQVAMEFTVFGVTGVAILRRPHRQGRFTVPSEESDPIAAADRGVNPVTRTGATVQQTMGIEHGVTQPCIAHPVVQSFVIGALRQPDAHGPFTDQPVVFTHGGAQLSANRLGVLAQQR